MINAAIVGLGWWGKNIVKAVQGRSDRLRFVRGVSKEPDTVRDLAREHGFDLSTALEDALADPRVQAVVLATPHSLHADQIVQVAQAGKPVFCEKPLTLKRADTVRAVEACRRAGVLLGVGHNKRFWPSMRELKKIAGSGELGEILHVEGHYSNENSGTHYTGWRVLPTESPAGGMTGAGLHILDAFSDLIGPVRYAHARMVSRKPPPDPHDTVSVLIEFANRVTGTVGTVRASPFYWRVHVFGRDGSAEALGENDLVVRRAGGKTETRTFEPVDSLRAEFDAFADAVAGRAPYPIPMDQMIATTAAFEAVVTSIETGVEVLLE